MTDSAETPSSAWLPALTAILAVQTTVSFLTRLITTLAPVITRELRALNRSDGLPRALRLAAAHPTPAVKQALLWASWNQTECSADCARLLVDIVGGKEAVAALAPQLEGLGFHRSFFERIRHLAAYD